MREKHPTTKSPRALGIAMIIAMVLIAIIACGPADESVQQQLGNLSSAATQDDTDTEPTTEPSPPPTRCAVVPVENNQTEEICYTPPTEVPMKYSKLDGNLSGPAQEAEKLAKSGKKRSDLNPQHADATMVKIYSNPDVKGAADTIKAWLKKEAITYTSHPEELFFSAGVPYTLMGPLSELPAVTEIGQEAPSYTPSYTAN